MRALFRQVTIVGLGLIGGSLGIALRKRRIAAQVFGIAKRPETIRQARSRGAIDRGSLQLGEGLKQAELVVIATPPMAVPTLARRIARLSRGPLLLTDVASTKGEIARELAQVLPSRISYVGSHPMAGSERSGILAADGTLFEGAYCIVTSTAGTSHRALARIEALWRSVGGRIVRVSAQRHDAMVAEVSHLPHLAAVGLVLSADSRSLNLAARGFSDTTRVALSDPALWRQILLTNRREIARTLDRFLREIRQLRDILSRQEGSRLFKQLLTAQQKRQQMKQ